MEPKFQSSFIPKGPVVSTSSGITTSRKVKEKSLLSFLATTIFTLSILLAAGMFGYGFYLKDSIDRMGVDLQNARATIQPENIAVLTRFHDLITSTRELISRHQVPTALFEFLETSTSRLVRFNDFQYLVTEQELELSMKGEARSYAALAQQADVFYKSGYFKDPVFSDLVLNERGDVLFAFRATVDQGLVSYSREVERLIPPPPPIESILPVSEPVATSTSSISSPQTATSTQN